MISPMFSPFARLLSLLLLALSFACGGGREPQSAAPPPASPVLPVPETGDGLEPADEAGDDPGAEPEAPTPPLMPIGVPECDAFVTKYVTCVDVRVPPELKERMRDELNDHRARWRELLKMDQGKLAAGLACRGVSHRLKGALTVDYGCEFR